MAGLLDNMLPFSFDGEQYPCESYTVTGGIRDHVHEYSHQDGGDPEKLGRSLYVIKCTLNMQGKFAMFPNLWPQRTAHLVSLWETSATRSLIVPSVGSIEAYAKGWTREWSYKLRSGEKVQVEFREDKANLVNQLFLSATSPASLETSGSQVAAEAARAKGLTMADQSLIASLQSLVNSLVAVRDTALLQGNLIVQRCGQLVAMCQEVDGLHSMQDPSNVGLMRAIHDLWSQCQKFAADAQQKNQPLQVYIVPMEMSIGRISVAIFGDATHAGDLCALNSGSFADPYHIAANTEIAYYPNQDGSGAGAPARAIPPYAVVQPSPSPVTPLLTTPGGVPQPAPLPRAR